MPGRIEPRRGVYTSAFGEKDSSHGWTLRTLLPVLDGSLRSGKPYGNPISFLFCSLHIPLPSEESCKPKCKRRSRCLPKCRRTKSFLFRRDLTIAQYRPPCPTFIG